MANFINKIKDADTGESYSIIPAIKMTVDDNFKLTVRLENPSTGEVLMESDSLDLPIESMITDVKYDSNNKQLVLTLQNGTQTRVDIKNALGGCLFTDDDKDNLDKVFAWYESENYVQPSLSYVSSTPNGGTYEKGSTQTVTKISATVTKGTSNIVKLEAFNGSAVIGTITENSITGAKTFGNLSISVSSNKNFKVKATCADGKTTEANTGSFTFVYPYYWGVIASDATISAALVTSLTKKVESKATKKPIFTANNQKMVFASPYTVSKITDPNGFDVTSTFTESTVPIKGLDGTTQTYYVYVTNDASTVSAFVMTFTH